MNPLSVYIGYDSRENDAYEVCAHSLRRHASIPLRIVRLDQSLLRYLKIYSRTFSLVDGQRIDDRDGRPFSTEFAFSRFLVPGLNFYSDWAIFCDCDFLFTADIAQVMDYADPKFACSVVKHRYEPKEQKKMDGAIQTRYRRKNWSSFVLWNCAHPDNRMLTFDAVNHEPGSWLHGFEWLKDEEIGEIPRGWNWLSGVSEPMIFEPPPAIHYTLGTPNMPGYEDCPFADLWRRELTLLRQGRRDRLRIVA